jgi:hypothetical protein
VPYQFSPRLSVFWERRHARKQPEQAQLLIQSTPEKAVDIAKAIRCASMIA